MVAALSNPTRRSFLAATGSAMGALAASGCTTTGLNRGASTVGYGPLMPDPQGLLDLPEGFTYRVLSRLGDPMSDRNSVPDNADGMGCIDLGGGRIALVRNHELQPQHDAGGILPQGFEVIDGRALPGGTTTLVLDERTLAVREQYRSLAGTIRNCSGGITPWGSWLTCEEAPTGPGQKYGEGLAKNHGWTFEVPADAGRLVNPEPLRAMGRFNHEAACVDPATGIVYQTEDRDDSLLYRFVPAVRGKLDRGGRLQALVLADGIRDSRNWDEITMRVGERHPVRWIDLEDVEAPLDDLRHRGAREGALLVARGEGIHMGTNELYICSTSGGAAKFGQVFRLVPSRTGGMDALELFFESENAEQFNFGDNLTTSPNGHLIVCEDQYTEIVTNRLIGITPQGAPYPLGLLRLQTELAGGCWSPNGKWFFVNAYSPTVTVAITGPWMA